MDCMCGCGKKVNKKKFAYGHRINWVMKNQNCLCQCGCGKYIKVEKFHGTRENVPQYIQGHHMKTLEYKIAKAKYNKEHTGELCNRWVKDRSKVRHWHKNFLLSQKREIYIRDNGMCQNCGAFTLWNVNKYDPLKANFDHIILVKYGGKTEVSNGQTLCLICHKLKHSAKAKRMNSRKPRTGNLEPSVQSTKVQRLLECSDTLNNQISVLPEREKIVQSR